MLFDRLSRLGGCILAELLAMPGALDQQPAGDSPRPISACGHASDRNCARQATMAMIGMSTPPGSRRIAGALGTAVFAIALQGRIDAKLPGVDGGIEELAAMSPAARAETAPSLADAFGSTFWIAIALIAVALVPALLLPKPPRDEAASEERVAERKAA